MPYFSATVAALPYFLKDRQSSGIPGLGGLLGGTGTGTDLIPTSIPTGLFNDPGSLTGSGSGVLPTGLVGNLEGGLTGGSGSGIGSVVSDLTSLGGSSTDDTGDGACQNVTVIFARGTSELGTLGSIVGPGLSKDIKSALNNHVAVEGVDYPADAAGIATEIGGTGGTGTQAMVKDVQTALAKCPDTQVVLSGYSQGAMLVHNTMNVLNGAQASSVKAAITFGDPFVGESINKITSGAFKSFCATGDPVCEAGAAISPSSGGTSSASTASHLGYGADTGAAATFIKSKVTV